MSQPLSNKDIKKQTDTIMALLNQPRPTSDDIYVAIDDIWSYKHDFLMKVRKSRRSVILDLLRKVVIDRGTDLAWHAMTLLFFVEVKPGFTRDDSLSWIDGQLRKIGKDQEKNGDIQDKQKYLAFLKCVDGNGLDNVIKDAAASPVFQRGKRIQEALSYTRILFTYQTPEFGPMEDTLFNTLVHIRKDQVPYLSNKSKVDLDYLLLNGIKHGKT